MRPSLCIGDANLRYPYHIPGEENARLYCMPAEEPDPHCDEEKPL